MKSPFGHLLSVSIAAAALLGAPARAESPKTKPPTLAVLYFDYSGKDQELAGLRKGLAQMLISDLSVNENVRLVERDRLQEVLSELELAKGTSVDPKTAAKIGKLLGAKMMVMGSYFSLAGVLRADARVVEVETGQLLHATGASGKADDFLSLEMKLSTALSTFLATSLPKSMSEPDPGGNTPTGSGGRREHAARPKGLRTKTALRYSKALEALDAGKKEEAKAELKVVLQEQPDFRLAALDLDKLIQ
jgi:TolB-like protein